MARYAVNMICSDQFNSTITRIYGCNSMTEVEEFLDKYRIKNDGPKWDDLSGVIDMDLKGAPLVLSYLVIKKRGHNKRKIQYGRLIDIYRLTEKQKIKYKINKDVIIIQPTYPFKFEPYKFVNYYKYINGGM